MTVHFIRQISSDGFRSLKKLVFQHLYSCLLSQFLTQSFREFREKETKCHFVIALNSKGKLLITLFQYGFSIPYCLRG